MGEESTNTDRSYYIDLAGIGDQEISLSVVIAERKCYEHRPREADQSLLDSEPQSHIAEITGHCSETADYLLQDTPLKEAIFRVILAGGNKPLSAQDVSDTLMERWAMSAYPRDLSVRVIERLLEHSENYHLVTEPEPEPELPPLDVVKLPNATDGTEDESETQAPVAEAAEEPSGEADGDAEPEVDGVEPPAGESAE